MKAALETFVKDTRMSGMASVFGRYMENEQAAVSENLRATFFLLDPIIYEGDWRETGPCWNISHQTVC